MKFLKKSQKTCYKRLLKPTATALLIKK